MENSENFPSLAQVLASIEEELRRGFTLYSPPEAGKSPPGSAPPWHRQILLDALQEEDWESAMHPVADLRPYLSCVTTEVDVNVEQEELDLIEHYVQCRCAELPMRLQTEALTLRNHEQMRRQHMKELILLTQFVVYASPRDDAQEVPSPSGMRSSTREYEERMDRQLLLIAELERQIIHEVQMKRRCAQRMMLFSAVTTALVRRLEELGSGGHINKKRRT